MEPSVYYLTSFVSLKNHLTQLNPSFVFVLVDDNTHHHCYPLIQDFIGSHQLIEIPNGELNKTLHSCELIWNIMTDYQAERSSVLLNLGGGMIGDLGGFAASCYKRGIRFIQLPTSLLAMVDASVGGKTGVNFRHFKNQIGSFSSAESTFIYPAFLKTLPQRELLSGFAEVIKHYLISDKESFYEMGADLNHFSDEQWLDLIQKNIEIKIRIAEADPFENSVRRSLNFGHTIGHAVESLQMNAQNLLHGEAVAIGIVCESHVSYQLKLISQTELEEIVYKIKSLYSLPSLNKETFTSILEFIGQDKKNQYKTNRFTLLSGIGNFVVDKSVEESVIIDSLNFYNSLFS